MNYEEAVAYIEETPKFTTKNKMEHTKECLKRLGDPQDKFRVSASFLIINIYKFIVACRF